MLGGSALQRHTAALTTVRTHVEGTAAAARRECASQTATDVARARLAYTAVTAARMTDLQPALPVAAVFVAEADTTRVQASTTLDTPSWSTTSVLIESETATQLQIRSTLPYSTTQRQFFRVLVTQP